MKILFAILTACFAAMFMVAAYDVTQLQKKLDHPVPTQAIGVFACGDMYAAIVSDSNGTMRSITPSSADVDGVLDQIKKVPPKQRSVVELEVGCPKPDTQTSLH